MVARRRPGKAWIALGLLLAVVAGCGVIRGTVSTLRALDKSGFGAPGIRTLGGDRYSVTVEKNTEDLDIAAVEAAGVVWRNLPFRIERLEVACGNGFGGKGRYAADRAELEQRFGARDPDLDRGFQKSDIRTVAIVIGALVVVGLVVLAGIVVLVLVLVRNSRRRRPPPGTWGPTGPGGVDNRGPQPPPPGYGPWP